MVGHVGGALVLFTTDGGSYWWSSSVVHYVMGMSFLHIHFSKVIDTSTPVLDNEQSSL